ncbi:MAG: hypothetical protein D6732_28295 [Methanobacteriota archaeon]|nr:MAG: hypothetical protein D6732_28295 [Euryarchaeota archaeon]
MKRKSQIFLLLTLLMLTFFVSITGILLDIQKARYTDPSSGVDVFLQTWDNSVENIKDLTHIALARYTQSTNTSNIDVEMQSELNELSNYLLSRGYTSSFLISTFNLVVAGAPSSYSISLLVQMEISDAKQTLQQSLSIDLTVSAVLVGSEISVFKILNGETIPISDATVTVIPPGTSTVTNLRNGNYLVSNPADNFDVITEEGIALQV